MLFTFNLLFHRYIRSQEAPYLIQSSYTSNELAKKKFILILREPVSREFSWYKHRARSCVRVMEDAIHKYKPEYITINNNETIFGYHRKYLCADEACSQLGCTHMPISLESNPLQHLHTFTQYIHLRTEIYQNSLYIQQINNWLNVIDRKQLFIINADYMFHNITDTTTRLIQFLGLKHSFPKGHIIKLPEKNINDEIQVSIDCKDYDLLDAHYQPYNIELYNYINNNTINSINEKSIYEPYFDIFINTRNKCV